MIHTHVTGYGRPALDLLTARVSEIKQQDPMAPVIILAPNNLAGIVARRHLAAGVAGFGGVAGIEVSTLGRLAERVANVQLAGRRPATRPVRAAAWRRALSHEPGVFGSVAEHPATVSALSRAYAEVRELGAESRERIATSGHLGSDLIRLHNQVEADLKSAWYDEIDVITAAVDVLGRDGFDIPVVLYLPQHLSPAERRFVDALGTATDLDVLLGQTGARRADNTVHAQFGTRGEPSLPVAVADEVLNASDSDDEVRCVVRAVLDRLTVTPASRIAVLYAAATPYARLLTEQLATAGIQVNGPGVVAVRERAVARTLMEVLALPDNDLSRPEFFRALAHCPVRNLATEDASMVPLTRWERMSRSAAVVGGTDWDLRLDRYSRECLRKADREDSGSERPWLAERYRKEAATAGDLRTFATRLADELGAVATAESWSALAEWAVRLFESLIGDTRTLATSGLPLEEQYAAAAIVGVLEGLPVLDELGVAPSMRTLRDVLEEELESAVPRAGKFGEGVLVAPLSHAVGLDLDAVYIVGLSEDQYPGSVHQDALLPETIRELAPELKPVQERLHEKYRHLLVAYASASHVIASFPRGDLRRSTHRIPNRWLLSTLRALSANSSLAATDWENVDYPAGVDTSGSFADRLLTTPVLGSDQEWRVRASLADLLDDPVVTAAGELIDARHSAAFTRFDGNLSHVSGLPDYATSEKSISPTALESYAACPHAFFVKRLLNVEPLEQPEDTVTISAADIGTFIHRCIELLVEGSRGELPGPGQPWTARQRDHLMEIADEVAATFEADGSTGHPRLWQGQRAAIAATLAGMLDIDDSWRAEVGAAVKASELAFGQHGNPAVIVPIASGRVLMKGSADKVDMAGGRLYVTDIKSGRKDSFKKISADDPTLGGSKLQLPVYAYAARERYGDPDTPVTTGYWFVHRDNGRVELDLTEDVERFYAETLEVLVSSIARGLFPARAPADKDFAWVQCWYCNPDGIGHAEQRERWERKRHDAALADLVALIEGQAAE